MTASLKLRALSAKISELQAQQSDLLKKRNLDIAEDISRLNLAHLDHMKLMGGLLFLSEKITTDDPITEDWLKAGEKFLRRQKGRGRGPTKAACQANPTDQPS